MRRRTVVRIAVVAVAAAIFGVLSAFAATRPDPMTESVLDGCGRDRIGIFFGKVPNWAYVNDRSYPANGPPPPPQWAKGYADSQLEPWNSAHPTSVDMPTTHNSFDFVTNLRVDAPYEHLIAGDEQLRNGNFKGGELHGRIHTEREEAALPLWAWPERGDRLELLGSWVWDCDHAEEGEHTEFHPYRALWVQRNPNGPSPRSPTGETEADLYVSTEKTAAGTQADCAHRSKRDEPTFRACVKADTGWHDVSGTYSFFLPAPRGQPPGSKLRIRVVDRGSTAAVNVRAVAGRGPVSSELYAPTKTGVNVTFKLSATPGRRLVVAKQIFVGWTPLPAARLPEHLRVRVRSLTIRRAMDPGCPPLQNNCPSVQTTRGDQTTKGPLGEWILYLDVAGMWQRWNPALVRARDGTVVPGRAAVDVYLPRGKPWRLLVTGRECDNGLASAKGAFPLRPCPPSTEFAALRGEDDPGHVLKQFSSPAASLGRHTLDAALIDSTCPPANKRGCFSVTVDVQRVNDAAVRAARSRRAR